jgi:hypothetical protein
LGPLEKSADGRSTFVDGAKPGEWIQGHARTVSALVHAADPIVLDDQFLRHIVDSRHEFDHQTAATAAAGTGGKIVEGICHRSPIKPAKRWVRDVLSAANGDSIHQFRRGSQVVRPRSAISIRTFGLIRPESSDVIRTRIRTARGSTVVILSDPGEAEI